MRRAKIVCTLGPASDSRERIRSLAEAGMSVARLNASHGSPEDRRAIVERVRSVDAEMDAPLAVMHDLPGPEVRTAPLSEPIRVDTGSTVEFFEGETATPDRIGLSFALDGVQPGDAVLLDDGRIETRVTSVEADHVVATVESGGDLGGRKGVNVPGVDLGLPVITDSDATELDVAADVGVDFVAASFVRNGDDIYEISSALEARDADVPVIAKIERADAVENLDSIIEAAYGVMVARGDLGVECPLEEVPMVQKRVIRRCHQAGVPVITATEMLDSMVHSRRPTRAEASDVANAVLDGTDAVMLSGETAIGDHPVRVVETMDRIVRDVEASEEYAEALERQVPSVDDTRTDALARSGRYLARDVNATAIVAATESGYTARKAAKYRPAIPIVAATTDDRVKRQLALSWGIVPKSTSHVSGADAIIQTAVQTALDTAAAATGDTVVVMSGMMTELDGVDTANTLKVHVASKRLTAGRSVVEGLVAGPVHRTVTGDLTDVPEGAILHVEEGFDADFDGDTEKLAGIIDANDGMTSYVAIMARELGIPMICGAEFDDDFAEGTAVTLDAERGVVYEGVVRDRN
ncbi:pyruvate kinase [Haloarculaceae archaeon H-GB2-1]|nr:pyruvate kinase [Haloarculaceae archaeon H-GB1-1]MEA5408206.1 pyruvate kinase [Haloarculaceae archaeon H-GB2-1]